MKRRLQAARAAEDWDVWWETTEALIEEGEALEPADYDLLQEFTEPDGPETYCVDADAWLYFGPGGGAWQ